MVIVFRFVIILIFGTLLHKFPMLGQRGATVIEQPHGDVNVGCDTMYDARQVGERVDREAVADGQYSQGHLGLVIGNGSTGFLARSPTCREQKQEQHTLKHVVLQSLQPVLDFT